MFALESVRTRLAITIAAEAKSTLPDQWQYYLDTADRMRRFAGKLRRSDLNVPPGHEECGHALEILRRLPMEDTAERLCRILRETIGRLEGEIEGEKHACKNQNSADSTDFTIL